MSFAVEKLKASMAHTNGLQSPNKFRVRIFPPGLIQSARHLEFLAESVNSPGLIISSSQVKPLGYGSSHEQALSPVYEDVTVVYRSPNDSSLTSLLHTWQKKVVNHDYAPGEGGSQGAFQVSYEDDYVGTVEITIFDQEGNDTRIITLNRAWPKNVGSQQLSWGARDQYSTVTATFTYRTFTTSDIRG